MHCADVERLCTIGCPEFTVLMWHYNCKTTLHVLTRLCQYEI